MDQQMNSSQVERKIFSRIRSDRFSRFFSSVFDEQRARNKKQKKILFLWLFSIFSDENRCAPGLYRRANNERKIPFSKTTSSSTSREKNFTFLYRKFSFFFSDEANPIEEQTKKQRRSDSNKSKIHRCRQCSFVSENKVRTHSRRIVKLNFVPFFFPFEEDFWTHQRLHIRPEKLLECPDCPFVTEYKHHLEYHLRNHAGSKPFKCSK